MQTLRRAIERGEFGRIYFVHARDCKRWGIVHGWLRLKKFALGGAQTNTVVQPPREKQTHEQAFRHFLQCIREGRRQTDSPGERAVKVMQIVEAIYRSAGQGGKQVLCGEEGP
jgi:predicted dehydrogenase